MLNAKCTNAQMPWQLNSELKKQFVNTTGYTPRRKVYHQHCPGWVLQLSNVYMFFRHHSLLSPLEIDIGSQSISDAKCPNAHTNAQMHKCTHIPMPNAEMQKCRNAQTPIQICTNAKNQTSYTWSMGSCGCFRNAATAACAVPMLASLSVTSLSSSAIPDAKLKPRTCEFQCRDNTATAK